MTIVNTMRGRSGAHPHGFDMARLIAQNSTKVALGNANMNARGDIVGPGGKITVSREEIAREYHNKNPKAVKQVALRSIADEVISYETPAEAMAKHQIARPKRKIIDSE